LTLGIRIVILQKQKRGGGKKKNPERKGQHEKQKNCKIQQTINENLRPQKPVTGGIKEKKNYN